MIPHRFFTRKTSKALKDPTSNEHNRSQLYCSAILLAEMCEPTPAPDNTTLWLAFMKMLHETYVQRMVFDDRCTKKLLTHIATVYVKLHIFKKEDHQKMQ